MKHISYIDALAELRKIMAKDGIRAGLIFLNSLTPHRFTALYRFDNETLKNLYFFDRENPENEFCDEIPVMASYCVFVRKSGKKFITQDSLHDERVNGHPKQQEVQSYCGVPLIDEQGNMFGTICHFDFRPIPIGECNIALMEAIASFLKLKTAGQITK